MKTGNESIDAIVLRRRILFAGFVACMEDARLPKCVMFGELVEGAGCVGRQKKERMGYLLDDLRAFDINADEWYKTTAIQDKGGWYKTAEQGAGRFMAKWTVAKSVRVRDAVRMSERDGKDPREDSPKKAKRARAGSLAKVD